MYNDWFLFYLQYDTSPLINAALDGHFEIAKMLVSNNANLDIVGEVFYTANCHAIFYNNYYYLIISE